MPPRFDPQPVLLEGTHVRLEPLTLAHTDGIFAASRDDRIWTHLLIPQFPTVAAVQAYIGEALKAQAAGTELPFATIRRSDGAVVGSTRFMDLRPAHRGLEIGWTWLNSSAQRTPINTEAKYLMLGHAFEVWGALRVQLKTDARNEQSRRAILRIGASFEGILRKQFLRPHDRYERDSAMFSLIESEWPAAKLRLEAMLAR